MRTSARDFDAYRLRSGGASDEVRCIAGAFGGCIGCWHGVCMTSAWEVHGRCRVRIGRSEGGGDHSGGGLGGSGEGGGTDGLKSLRLNAAAAVRRLRRRRHRRRRRCSLQRHA